mgnify:FL=1|jgi:hypothetical protein|tara:strand:- start:1378 stop:1734 length:357 start_codon:yes stop_codon:yes gene_type:complete
MHGSAPKLLIIAKREVMGEEMPDFSGDSYVEAKKKAVESGDPPDKEYSDDPREAMTEMIKQLRKASKLHAGQADKLMEICEQMFGESKEMADSDADMDDEKPHKSYGDHNPYGSHKKY